jgi:hypothetical protein
MTHDQRMCLYLVRRRFKEDGPVRLNAEEREAVGRPAAFFYGDRVLLPDWAYWRGRSPRSGVVVRDLAYAWVKGDDLYFPYRTDLFSGSWRVQVYIPSSDGLLWVKPIKLKLMGGDAAARSCRKAMPDPDHGPEFKFCQGQKVTIVTVNPQCGDWDAVVSYGIHVPSSPVSNFYWVRRCDITPQDRRHLASSKDDKWIPERKLVPLVERKDPQ